MPSVLLDYPLLSPGDQMGRDEFLGRWYQMPGLKFAELIEGAVYMSPLSLRQANRDNLIPGLLFSYAAHVPDCQPLTNATSLMTPTSVPQPDASLRWVREVGGRSRVDDELMAGVPELADPMTSGRSASYTSPPACPSIWPSSWKTNRSSGGFRNKGDAIASSSPIRMERFAHGFSRVCGSTSMLIGETTGLLSSLPSNAG